MDSLIIDPVEFSVSQSALEKHLHLRNTKGEFERLFNEALAIAHPRAYYRTAYVDDHRPDGVTIEGVSFTSKVMAINLAKVYRVFPYVVTAGIELDAWINTQPDMLNQFLADSIGVAVVEAAAKTVRKHVAERYELGKSASMNPGSLRDWPIENQAGLFSLFDGNAAKIGVRLTESFLMIPAKTVSGIQYLTEDSFESCQLCMRENCLGRRAAFNRDLYEKKYQLNVA
ncbi:MAG: vitamin B12 dependent methionine synthase [Anaerolineaceae bacterium]